MNNCISCGKEISKYAIRCNSCSKRKEFSLEYSKLNFTNYCISCGKEISKGAQKCHNCEHKGENNPRYKKEKHLLNYCLDCRKKISRFAKRCRSCSVKGERNPFYGKYSSEKLKRILSKVHSGKIISEKQKKAISDSIKGDKNPLRRPEVVEKVSKSLMNHYVSKETRKKLSEKALLRIQNTEGPFKDTVPELKMKEILNELNIQFEHQFRLENRLYDFHLSNTNILIEVDGDYHHGNPKFYNKFSEYQLKNKEHDTEANRIAKKLGYIVMRFWEDDILNNENQIKIILINLIKG